MKNQWLFALNGDKSVTKEGNRVRRLWVSRTGKKLYNLPFLQFQNTKIIIFNKIESHCGNIGII